MARMTEVFTDLVHQPDDGVRDLGFDGRTFIPGTPGHLPVDAYDLCRIGPERGLVMPTRQSHLDR